MQATINHKNKKYRIDLSKPLDISILMRFGDKNLTAWYMDAPQINPVQDGDWVGRVSQGASVNFNTINFNPHAHGTHTECVGHITAEFYGVNDAVSSFFCNALVVTIAPVLQGADMVIDKKQLSSFGTELSMVDALVIRTFPNEETKKYKHYSYTNWPYLTAAAAKYIQEMGIQHLLIDLPSVDKEKDEGKLLAHKAFWKYPEATRYNATITEFIYVPNTIKDGCYILNLQLAPFENDAAPSRPVLYEIFEELSAL